MLEAIEKAKEKLSRDPRGVSGELCRCGRLVTFKSAMGGTELEVLHPQPPCTEFADFVAKLVQLADGQRV